MFAMHFRDSLLSTLSRLNIDRRVFLRLNFYRCHLAYFTLTILITSAVIYGSTGESKSSSGRHDIRYIDALFLAASAMTTTGLNSVNLGSITGYQQSVLFVLMLLGDLSTTSISVVIVRRWFFRKRMAELCAKSNSAKKILQGVDEESAQRTNFRRGLRQRGDWRNPRVAERQAIGLNKAKILLEPRSARKRTPVNYGGVLAPWEWSLYKHMKQKAVQWLGSKFPSSRDYHYLTFDPSLDGKGRFRSLTSTELAELGGVEYRALNALCWILPAYAAFWILLLMVILPPYASQYDPVTHVIRETQTGNLSPAWWGIFISLSAYTNCGLSPLNASMIPFKSNWLILILSGSAVIAGNTFYPVFLRSFVWILWKLVPKHSDIHGALSFLLHHPRRCYLWLFDRKTTVVLAATQSLLILSEWLLFEVLNINQTAISTLDVGTRIMDGVYQSLGTRSSGFYIVTISSIAPALQVLYLIVMYISVFPILVSLRSTNVYEERSVGLDAYEYEKESAKQGEEQRRDLGSLMGMHIRNQLAYDLWWMALSWVLICIIEESQLNTAKPGYDLFTILFEVVSAYGNCGLSLGVPDDYFSLSATFHTLSKLVLIAVMLRGRHRILPLAIDRSIMLPGEGLMEEMDRHYSAPLREGNRVEDA